MQSGKTVRTPEVRSTAKTTTGASPAYEFSSALTSTPASENRMKIRAQQKINVNTPAKRTNPDRKAIVSTTEKTATGGRDASAIVVGSSKMIQKGISAVGKSSSNEEIAVQESPSVRIALTSPMRSTLSDKAGCGVHMSAQNVPCTASVSVTDDVLRQSQDMLLNATVSRSPVTTLRVACSSPCRQTITTSTITRRSPWSSRALSSSPGRSRDVSPAVAQSVVSSIDVHRRHVSTDAINGCRMNATVVKRLFAATAQMSEQSQLGCNRDDKLPTSQVVVTAEQTSSPPAAPVTAVVAAEVLTGAAEKTLSTQPLCNEDDKAEKVCSTVADTKAAHPTETDEAAGDGACGDVIAAVASRRKSRRRRVVLAPADDDDDVTATADAEGTALGGSSQKRRGALLDDVLVTGTSKKLKVRSSAVCIFTMSTYMYKSTVLECTHVPITT